MINIPSIEDPLRYTAPKDQPVTEEDEVDPYQEGWICRLACISREFRRFYWDKAQAEWERGWDACDAVCKEGEL